MLSLSRVQAPNQWLTVGGCLLDHQALHIVLGQRQTISSRIRMTSELLPVALPSTDGAAEACHVASTARATP